MNLKIKYFGLLAEVTKCNEETVEISESTISEVLQILFNKYPSLKEKDFQVVQNNEIVSREIHITNNEIALLPPFSGG